MIYPKDFINKIIQGNCIDLLKHIPDNSIDLCLTDPPYDIDFSKYDTLTDKGGRKFHYTEKLKWNTIDLKKLSKILFKELDRIIKDNGSIIIFGPQEWGYYYYKPAIDNNFDLKCQLIWIKDNPIPQFRKKNYRSTHENIVWFARYKKDKCPFTFNFINQAEMKNVFKTPILQGKERWDHPTQKPLSLIEKLIMVHSNKKNIVLDPFLGSGTTAVACQNLHRNFIGIESDLKYVKMALERLRQHPLI